MPKYSTASNNIFGQPMFQVLSKIKEKERNGANIVHFEIGDPDFDSPAEVIEAGCRALRNGVTHYADSTGDYELKEAIISLNEKVRGFRPDIGQVLITPGANPIIFYAIACVANPGDEIIIPDPCFSTYISVIKFLGCKVVFVPLKEENGFRMNPDDVEAAITDRTRLILVNSPNNPTGSVMKKEELDRIAITAKEHNIFLYLDDIYREIIYTEDEAYSPASLDGCKDFIIVADGFSKAYAMTGWRLGYAIAPNELTRKMGLLLETTASCVPPFVQKAGIAAITSAEEYMKHMVATYKRRRDIIVGGLNKINGISCVMPEGAFYIFANIKKTGLRSQEFQDIALEKCNVGLVAGDAFGESGEGFVRFCYALNEDSAREGIRRLAEYDWTAHMSDR